MVQRSEMIQSGRTVQAAAQMIEWYNEEYEYVKNDMDWIWGINEASLERLLDSRTKIPFREFMVHYLLFLYADDLKETYTLKNAGSKTDSDKEWIHEKAQSIFKAVEEDSQAPSENSDSNKEKTVQQESKGDGSEILNALTKLVFHDFVLNGFYKSTGKSGKITKVRGGEAKSAGEWDFDTLRQKITADSIKIHEFYAFAFGLNMEYPSVELFLKKYFFVPGLDFWKEDDFFHYLTFQYGGERKYELWSLLKEEYKKITEKRKAARTLAKKMTGKDFSTRTVQNVIDAFVKTKHISFYPEDAFPDGQLSDEIKNLLGDYYDMVGDPGDYTRTYKKEMAGLLKDINTYLSWEMNDYDRDLKDSKKEEKKDVKAEQVFAEGKVTIYYSREKGLYVPGGTQFYSYKKGKNPIIFVSQEEVNEKPSSEECYKEGEIELRSADVWEKDKLPGIPAHSVFYCEDPALAARIQSMDNRSLFKVKEETEDGKEKKAKDIKNGELVHTGGRLFLSCTEGTVIPKGTIFRTESGSGILYFVTKEEVGFFAEKDVSVVCEQEGVNAPIGSICDCAIKDWQKRFIRIENKEFLKGRKAENRNKNRENEKKGALCKFLYPTEAADWEYSGILRDEYFIKLNDVLKGTDFSAADISNIDSKNEMPPVNRCDLITFSFLAYASRLERMREKKQLKPIEDYAVPGEHGELTPETLSRYSGFVIETNERLAKCGFYELYQANPYDTLIIYLLTSRDAVNAFRNLWGWYLARKQSES